MKNSVLYLYSNMDKSSQILLFLIILVFLMLASIFIINFITKKKNQNNMCLTNKSKFSSKTDIKPTVNMNKNNAVISNKENIIKAKEKSIMDLEKENPKKIEIISDNDDTEVIKIEKETSIDDISNLIEKNNINKPIDLTRFEEDQEENAIISYDELVKRAGAKKIVYKCEDKNIYREEEQIEQIDIDNKPETKIERKFKASKVISPVFGVQKEESNEIDNFIDLEDFTISNNSNNEESDAEFLNKLKEFRSTLD